MNRQGLTERIGTTPPVAPVLPECAREINQIGKLRAVLPPWAQ